MKEAQKCSKYPIVANELKYSLWKKSDLKTIEHCQENDIMVIAYKVFGRGKLTTHKIPLVEELSKKYNRTKSQIILNWVVSKKNMVSIFKSLSIEHLKENKDIFDFKLTAGEIKKLDAIVPSL